MTKKDGITAGGITHELRRGALVIAILSQLGVEHYGYSLRESLAAKGLDINEGTLYPLLRRLESQGLLKSSWKVEGSRPRRYYGISAKGKKVLAEASREWDELGEVMKRLLKK
jgi:DNA-binding PadR family transcriptional regulator